MLQLVYDVKNKAVSSEERQLDDINTDCPWSDAYLSLEPWCGLGSDRGVVIAAALLTDIQVLLNSAREHLLRVPSCVVVTLGKRRYSTAHHPPSLLSG